MIAACPFPSHQGTQVFIRHLANALAAAGHAVHLITYGESEPVGANLDPRVAWHRAVTPPVGFRSGPSPARIAADAGLLRHTLKLLATRDIDVLHAHNVEGLAIGAVASGVTHVPLVYHAHTRLDAELPLYASTALGRRLARAVGATFERVVPRAAKAVICFDGEQAARFRHAGVPTARLHVIPLGLAMNELANDSEDAGASRTGAGLDDDRVLRARAMGGAGPGVRSRRVDGGPARIAYAGNPDPYQNLELLGATFALLRRDHPELTLRLISNHPRETFGALAHAPGVEHVGYASPMELAARLRACDVGLVTRTLSVGAPVKALTYLSAGLPVVACARGAGALLGAVPAVSALTDATPQALAEGARRFLVPGAVPEGAFDHARQAFEIHDQIMAYDAVYAAV